MIKKYTNDGDLGSGQPGSLSWHKINLRQLDTASRVEYIREAFPNMNDEDKLEVAVFLITES